MHQNEHSLPPLPDIVGNSIAMQDVYKLVRLAAPRTANVLLIGETGTGKEVIAKAIHKCSKRAEGPYIRVNCGALHENLLESELFGHVKGAFTGAIENKAGRFEAAHGGTIFLDEINSMSPKLQVKLLRVLQEREFERVGESSTRKVDVRLIAATNASLEDLVDRGEFREDLYYRLNVVAIPLPPLRERKDDIPELAQFFLRRFAEANKLQPTPEIPGDVMSELMTHTWPGNVRELENSIERLVVLSEHGRLSASVLRMRRSAVSRRTLTTSRSPETTDLPTLMKQLVSLGLHSEHEAGKTLYDWIVGGVERELIEQVLQQCDHIQVKAAQRLGINRNTLHKKTEEYKASRAAVEVVESGV
jgi:transcriptional regulator with PAS, ATPase and Fis domain